MEREPDTLDRKRWLELWSRLGAYQDGLPVFHQLTLAYAEPARAYHTAEHIRDCLAQFDLSRDLAQRPDEVETALWFHDAVYAPSASDNEARSAELARTALSRGSVPRQVIDRMAGLVLSTRHVTLPSGPDERLICDIDLSILGRAPETFDEFERRIRREYAWVPEPLYRRERSAVLSGFLRRRSIYQTDHFRHRYEAPARANLQRLIEKLGAPR